MSLEDITNPLEYIECIIAFDVRDWSEDRRLAAIYAIVFGWGSDKDNDPFDYWSKVKGKFGWSDEGVERLKKLHEEWERLRKEERNEADELRDELSACHDYMAKLEAECKDLTKELREAKLAVEHNRHVAEEEALKKELSYRDGMIAGLKYAISCNVGEVNR